MTRKKVNNFKTYVVGHHHIDDNIKLYIVKSDSPENAVWEAVESRVKEEWRRERFSNMEEVYEYYGQCDHYIEVMEITSEMI